MNIIRSWFCNHSFRFHRNIYGDEILERGYKRSIWWCEKCGKLQLRDDLEAQP